MDFIPGVRVAGVAHLLQEAGRFVGGVV